MLKLPLSLRLTRMPKAEERLLEKTKIWLAKEERDPRIHVSDLLDPRLAYWQRVKPEPISDRMATIFLVGKVLHAFVLSAVGNERGVNWQTDEGTQWSEKLGICWSADKILDGQPCELKTSRSLYEPRGLRDVELYCEQLLCYMAAMNKTTGQLWILFLNMKDDRGYTAPSFRCYGVSVSKKDLQWYQQEIIKTRLQLQLALRRKDPKDLPLCREFKCGLIQCRYWKDCRPAGRYGVERSQWQR